MTVQPPRRMKMLLKRTPLVAALLAATSTPVFAGYVDARPPAVEPDVAQPARPATATAPVIQAGQAPSTIEPSRGGAKGFSVIDAVSQFAPQGWRVVNGGANVVSVDWFGAPSWLDTLTTVMQATGNQALVAWDQKVVQIRRVPAAATNASHGAQAAPEEKRWAITKEDTYLLRDSLARWARLAGWQLNSSVTWDFPVQATGEFEGDFETAVESLMKALTETDRPVRAVLHDDGRNRVVDIVPFAN